MKLMLRPEWRIWPLVSFFGLLDIKTGVVVALLFALLNKVAGVYGLIAVFTGAGGSFAQLSLYIYSVVALVALAWGLHVVKQEDPKQTLYFAHLFAADHVVSTAWTVFFALVWWLWTPHDGRLQKNSLAQEQIKENSNVTLHLTPEEREVAARAIWDHEKGMAAAVIVVSWLFKIYFAALLYSYATHLRTGSYRALPRSRPGYTSLQQNGNIPYSSSLAPDDDFDEEAGVYGAPSSSPVFAPGHRSTPSGKHRSSSSFHNGHRRGHSRGTSLDFVSAPGRPQRKLGAGSVGNLREMRIAEEDVIFDEDAHTLTLHPGRSSSHPPSRLRNEAITAGDLETTQ